MVNAKQKPNRLANEKSPYLLQHAHNPVDWYPWSAEAFFKAEKEDKPIFLSIGYSTCHWCHVMERESFEDEDVAKLLNDQFVAIKVDREERPDIDAIYMKACLIITGSGGWPLTIIMTPRKQPFFAGTYIPKNSRAGMIGLVDLLRKVEELWRQDRPKLSSTAKQVTEYLTRKTLHYNYPEEPTETLLDEAFIRLLDRFDHSNGGFGSTPKFPSSHNLLFLLRFWARKRKTTALAMVEKTLLKMKLGGIFDQVGFGFHRYSTDAKWLVPHFEKMLYDQALMSLAYIETYQVTRKAKYRIAAEEILEYVLRDMTSPNGGFYSAEDADSEGQEGKFYLWTEPEIRTTLGEHADVALHIFNIAKEGNYQDELYKHKTGKNILYLKKPLSELSGELTISFEELTGIYRMIVSRLFAVRKQRIHPAKDDKILTDWNGLMIAALAKGAIAFSSKKHAAVAQQTVTFILKNFRRADGRLLHRYRDGEAAIDANLNDYTYLIWGLIELYEATFTTAYLEEALRLQEEMLEHFWDKDAGGFFFTADDSEELLIRNKVFRDKALPSGNAVALLNLLRLARMTGNTRFEETAESIVKAFALYEEGAPAQNTMYLTALDFFFGPIFEIVIVGDLNADETQSMLQAIRTEFIPNKVILVKTDTNTTLEKLARFTKNMKMVEGQPTAYICRNFICNRPVTNVNIALEILRGG